MCKKPLPQNIIKAHLGLLSAILMWAAAGPIIKITLGYIPPATFLFLRFLIVGILLLPYAVYELLKVNIHKKDYLNLFLLGLLSQSSLLILFWAYKYTTVLDISIISVLGAIASVYLGHYFYKDKVNNKLKIGLILASIGTLVVVIEPLLTGAKNNVVPIERLFGNFLAVLYNIAWLTFVVWSKMSMGERSSMLKKALSFIHIRPMKSVYSPSLITAVSFYVGLITVMPIAIFENMQLETTFSLATLNPLGIFGLLYMAIVSSIMAYMLYEYGLEYAKVSDAAIYGYLQPVFTVPFAYFLVREVPNVYMIIGGAIIAIGVIIAESHKS